MGDSDDFYELYEEYLDNDGISPEEGGFMKGFNEEKPEKGPEKESDDELVQIEVEDIDLAWDEGSDAEEPAGEDTDESSKDKDGF